MENTEKSPCNPCARVAIVGNGPSILLRGERGDEIDSHDEVVRFNKFAINGFEKFTGIKTTLWSTYGRGTLPTDENHRPDRMIFIHGRTTNPVYPMKEIFGIERKYYDLIRSRVKSESKRTGEESERLLPSSGLLVTFWLIEVHSCKNIEIYGMDHFSKEESKLHHYWVNKNFGKPREHDGEAEHSMLLPYIESGIIALK